MQNQVDDAQDNAKQDQDQATAGPVQTTTQAASVNPDERMDTQSPNPKQDKPRAFKDAVYPGKRKLGVVMGDDGPIGNYNWNISKTIVERLRLAGARLGIYSTSRLVEIAILGYLQHCAVVTRLGLDAKLGRYSPGQPLSQDGQVPTGTGQPTQPPPESRAETT